jgi:hypothetical protein
MSESQPKMTPEAVAHREPLNAKTTKELFDGVSDLVDDRFSADSGKLRYKAGATIGENGASKRVGGRFESRSQLEDIAAYESQIRLGVMAKEVAPAIEVIDTALAAAHARLKLQNERSKNKSTLKEVAVIRHAIVESGTMSALEVGKLTDDEIAELMSYARKAGESETDDEATPSLDTSKIDAHFGNLPFDTPKIDAFFANGTKSFDTSTIDNHFGNKAINEALDTTTIDNYFNNNPDDAADVDPIGTHDTSTDSPELQAKYAELTAARDAWARISSKRQRRAFDRGIKDDEYGRVEANYKQLLREYGRMKLASQLEAANDDTAKNALVITYLAEEQNELRNRVKHETDSKWYNAVSRFLNKGSRKQRIAKGIVLGLVVGGVAGVAGAAGAGVAVTGGIIAAGRFVRGYTSRHTDGMGQLESDFATKSKLQERSRVVGGDSFDFMANQYDDKFESDTKREQGKRRKAFAYGAGSVAVGSLLGYGIHAGVEHFVGGDEASAAAHPGEGGGGNPGDGADAGSGNTPDVPKGPALHELADASDTYNVHPGEGWYETFKDMGIPKDQWTNVLHDAGPKLHEQGWAYFDNTHDEWRISKPGHLPEGVVDTLKNASAKHGFSFK